MSNKFLTASLAFSTSSSAKAAANDRQRPADATSMVSLPLHLDLSLPASFQPLLKLSIYCSLVVIFSFAPDRASIRCCVANLFGSEKDRGELLQQTPAK